MNNPNPRKLAITALCRVETDGAYSNIALNSILKEHRLSQVDKALCTVIFYGTLDRKITIDYVLKQYVKSGFNKIKPFVLNTLRSAVYQIMYMDKIPESAAVNEAVKIIKSSKDSYSAGFVNGVLRNILRNKPAIPQGDLISDMSVRYSAPEWIVKSLVQDYSLETAKTYLESCLAAPVTYVRVNTNKCTIDELLGYFKNEEIVIEKTELDTALRISNYSSIESMDLYKKGYFFVQDLACQFAINSLGISENDNILDLCAAPGGKSFTAALSANNVTVTSTDLYEQRVNLIKKGAGRLSIKNVTTYVCDASQFNSKLGQFDKIICDVPCSGIGVIGRKPDIKYHAIDNFKELQNIQYSILTNADKYLKRGGKILYSTCTLRKAENEDIVNKFLSENKNYLLMSSKTYFPHLDKTDGFYSAVLLKN